jgi:hypothetical protein
MRCAACAFDIGAIAASAIISANPSTDLLPSRHD